MWEYCAKSELHPRSGLEVLKGQLENELTRIVQRMPRRLFAECLYSSSFCLLICDLKFRYGLRSAATTLEIQSDTLASADYRKVLIEELGTSVVLSAMARAEEAVR